MGMPLSTLIKISFRLYPKPQTLYPKPEPGTLKTKSRNLPKEAGLGLPLPFATEAEYGGLQRAPGAALEVKVEGFGSGV